MNCYGVEQASTQTRPDRSKGAKWCHPVRFSNRKNLQRTCAVVTDFGKLCALDTRRIGLISWTRAGRVADDLCSVFERFTNEWSLPVEASNGCGSRIVVGRALSQNVDCGLLDTLRSTGWLSSSITPWNAAIESLEATDRSIWVSTKLSEHGCSPLWSSCLALLPPAYDWKGEMWSIVNERAY